MTQTGSSLSRLRLALETLTQTIQRHLSDSGLVEDMAEQKDANSLSSSGPVYIGLPSVECDRCGEYYQYYNYSEGDTNSDNLVSTKSKYNFLCRPCRLHLYPNYVVPGDGDIEPKRKVEE